MITLCQSVSAAHKEGSALPLLTNGSVEKRSSSSLLQFAVNYGHAALLCPQEYVQGRNAAALFQLAVLYEKSKHGMGGDRVALPISCYRGSHRAESSDIVVLTAVVERAKE